MIDSIPDLRPNLSKTMKLREIVQNLSNYRDETVILISDSELWTAQSEAVVKESSEFEEKLPRIAGFTYFLEVEIAKDVVATLHEWRKGEDITLLDEIDAVIYYAKNDAYLS
jgi:hypothetical protein